jgi:penicillin-binding protein 1A
VLALALERKFSKDQILELYLNRVYFGGGAYGIDAASRTFFGHGAEHLSLGEAAIIAGLVKAPSNYSPTADVEAARGRAGVVLNSMVENGFLSASAAAGVDPATIRSSRRQAEQRPLFHRLGAAAARHADRRDQRADRRVDHARPGMQSPPTARSTPMRRAARRARWSRSTATARCGRWSAAATMSIRSTTARPRPSASRDRRSSCSSISPRSNRDEADRHDRRRAGHDRRLDPAQLDPHQCRAGHAARGLLALDQHDQRQDRRAARLSTIADMARRFGISGKISTYPSMVLGTSDVRLIDMTRAFASVPIAASA